MSASEPCLHALLDRNANVNAGDFDNWTPLHECAARNAKACAKLLLERMQYSFFLNLIFFYTSD